MKNFESMPNIELVNKKPTEEVDDNEKFEGDIEKEISIELAQLEENCSELKKEVEEMEENSETIGELDKEDVKNVASSAKRLISYVGVIASIPVISNFISPEVSQKIVEINSSISSFVNGNTNEILVTMVVLSTITFSILFSDEIKKFFKKLGND